MLDLYELWTLTQGALSLQFQDFQEINSLTNGLLYATPIALLSGLSVGFGQIIILFVNRVTPIRFIFSLLINAVLYTFGFLFLVFSTWLICLVPGSVHLSFSSLVKVLGLSYAPLLLGFLGAIPYLGVPIISILSVWHLLAMVVGFAAIAQVPSGIAFGYVAFGWIVLQILQQTIGQPIANFGRWLADLVAGVQLKTRNRDIVQLIQTGLSEIVTPVTNRVQLGGGSTVALQKEPSSISKTIEVILFSVGMIILGLLIAVLLQPLRSDLFGWYKNAPNIFQWSFDLLWIGFIAIAVAGLLAPLETLGWWAGWYSDEVDPTVNIGQLAEPISENENISRYLIYLDGIGQSSSQYLPDVEDFLDALAPALPNDIALIRGLMTYSVMNNPLDDENRPLAFLWRTADRLRLANPASLLGLMVNIRNVLIVAVSADQRYGPIYNQGIAQIMYNSLISNGYKPNSNIPITLIGYSGGGQMSAASAPFLRRATGAPIDVISLGGVISGNCNILKLEHLYHLKGEQDSVERLGPIMFPGRWKIFSLSYWNRAKRRGKISIISLGPVGHQVPGGLLDPNARFADGRSHLQQTIDYILKILRGQLLITPTTQIHKQLSNYALYKQADINCPSYYPLTQTVDLSLYQPIGEWMGRLILPELSERSQVRGVLFKVHHTPREFEHLIGQIVNLRWGNDPYIKYMRRALLRDVHFSADAEYTSKYGGLVHPDRLNHWRQVDPLESLAGSRPVDDVIVMLCGKVETRHGASLQSEKTKRYNLYIHEQPVQISGRYYALVKFITPITGTDRFKVIHFNPNSKNFDGVTEVVRMPPVIADQNGCYPSTVNKIEQSLLNDTGWYIYGAKDQEGRFVVQSLAPRSLLRLVPDRVLFGTRASYQYIRQETWADIKEQKGKISSVLLCGGKHIEETGEIQQAISTWNEGDQGLVLHVYGGIGGKKKEPAAATPIFFGHFAYGVATVIREPIAGELVFDIRYYQVYTHNTDGLIAGTLHWSRYMGDRQFGWAGVRPVCDLIIKHTPVTKEFDFDFDGIKESALSMMELHLQAMTARYRIGDGTGGTYVGPANNCSQDSNQALFASIRHIQQMINSNHSFENWLSRNPIQAGRYQQLVQLGQSLQKELQPFGAPRSDWENNEYNLGSTLEDAPLRNLWTGISSWKTLLPRFASDRIVQVFLKQGASVWVLRTNQIGGDDPDIEPISPFTL
ncbi:CAAX protease [Aphanothece hegewaldii]|nr:CAAX protease [Aphanothece hegewaldii]